MQIILTELMDQLQTTLHCIQDDILSIIYGYIKIYIIGIRHETQYSFFYKQQTSPAIRHQYIIL